MAVVLKDRVKVTSGVVGTGTATLGAAAIGYQNFAAIGDGSETYYTIALQSGGEWEVGKGTVTETAGVFTLSRDTVLESSNAGSLVNFSAGTKDVFVTYPAERAVYLDAVGSAVTTLDIGTLGTSTANITTANITAGTVATAPTSGNDLVNKTYVDTLAASGIHFHQPVRVESPINLNATYNNGTAGVGATLTNAGTQAALVIDGVTVNAADRVLVYEQTNQTQNGIYVVTDVGSGSTNWVLTRASDADTYVINSAAGLSEGSTTFVQQGATGAGETYTCNTSGTITFGTTNITFAQISSAQIYSAGTGLTLSGTQFSITNTGTAGTYGSASQVPVFVTNAQGQVTSVTNTAIGITSAAVSGLAASATTDTTNAANITSGTLPVARLNGSYTGITGVGTLAAGTWNGSTIAAAYGGTGQSSYAVGDLLYAATSSSLAKLADVVSGNALISGGVGAAPAWGKIGLTTHVSGTLAVANGGTGATTLTGYVYGNGTGAMSASTSIPNSATTATSANTASAIVARDASGNFTANTITAALSGNATSATTAGNVSGTVAVGNGGTGATSLATNNVILGNGTAAVQTVAPGTSGNVLTSNGATWTSAAAPASGGSITATASGAISAGDAIVVNTDGTVSKVGSAVLTTPIKGTEYTAATTVGPNSLTTLYVDSCAYDPISGSYVFVYKDSATSQGKVVAATVSGGVFTYGTPITFVAASVTALSISRSSTGFIVCYANGSLSNAGYAIAGTVSGTTITLGTAVQFNGSATIYTSATYDSSAGQVLVAFDNNYTNGQVVPLSVSGTTISVFGAAVFFAARVDKPSIAYNTALNRTIVTFGYNATGQFAARTFSNSSGTLTFGSTGLVSGYGAASKVVYDAASQKMVVVYSAASTIEAAVITLSGTTFTVGAISTAGPSAYGFTATYDALSGTILFVYQTSASDNFARLVLLTVSGTALTVGTATALSSVAVNGVTAASSGTTAPVLGYIDNTTLKTFIETTVGSNLTAENFIGFSGAPFTNGTTATVKVGGSAVSAFTGLTAGETYYVTTSNTLSTAPGNPYVVAGTAVSSTSLLINTGAPGGLVGTTDTQTLTNKTLSDPIVTLNASQGTAGQVPVSQGTGLPPVWGNVGGGFEVGDTLVTSRALTAPEWLPANGSVYLQSSYPELFALTGLLPDAQLGNLWTARTSGFGSNIIWGVGYGNGLYVAVGNSGVLSTSPEGITWTTRTSGFGTTAIFGVAYGAGLFVAVGARVDVATSPDGITWTARYSGFGSASIRAITYGNGLFVAVGSSGQLATSPDGITWTSRSSGFNSFTTIRGVAYSNGLFAAVAENGTIRTSPDGITWTARTSNVGTISLYSVTAGEDLFVAVGATGTIVTSLDGITWTPRASQFPALVSTGSNDINCVGYGSGMYVAGGAGGNLITSLDGAVWTTRISGFPSAAPIRGATYGNGVFVIVGDSGNLRTSSLGYSISTQFATPLSSAAFSGLTAYVKASA